MQTDPEPSPDRTIAVLTFDVADDRDAAPLLAQVHAFAESNAVTILDAAVVGARLLVAMTLVGVVDTRGHPDTTMHALLRELALPRGARVGIVGAGLRSVLTAAGADAA